jgi:hypothetical protein
MDANGRCTRKSRDSKLRIVKVKGRAVAQAVSRRLPTATVRVRVRAGVWCLWWTKRHWGRFSPSTSVSPANHSTIFAIIIIIRGWHNSPVGGCSAEWTQLDSTPHYIKIVKVTVKNVRSVSRSIICRQPQGFQDIQNTVYVLRSER